MEYDLAVVYNDLVNGGRTGQSTGYDSLHKIQHYGHGQGPPDFSYAGYGHSEAPIPVPSAIEPTGRRLNVCDYGLVADGYTDNSSTLQKLLDQVVQTNDVVFFPSGTYALRSQVTFFAYARGLQNIRFVGEGRCHSVIFSHVRRDNFHEAGFVVRGSDPQTSYGPVIGTVIGDVYVAGSHSVKVKRVKSVPKGEDASTWPDQPRPGDPILIRQRPKREHFASIFGRSALPKNDQGFGAKSDELILVHLTVEKVDRDKQSHNSSDIETWHFKEPLPYTLIGHDLHKDIAPVELRAANFTEGIGFDNLGFATAWRNYPEEFRHHKDKTHDFGFNGLCIRNCRNVWVRKCGFYDANIGLLLFGCHCASVLENVADGKVGHFCFTIEFSSFVLSAFNRSVTDYWHGPISTNGRAMGCVWLDVHACCDQRCDFHTRAICMTLLDNYHGGTLAGNGGAKHDLPHHWNSLWIWNMTHRATRDSHYDFWPTDLSHWPQSMFSECHVVGLRSEHSVSQKNATTWVTDWQSEIPSLFLAQLERRLRSSEDRMTKK
eukprot:Clim_evm120s134 gene=Clim_evmTU120s134